jgi:hypothetical protein
MIINYITYSGKDGVKMINTLVLIATIFIYFNLFKVDCLYISTPMHEIQQVIEVNIIIYHDYFVYILICKIVIIISKILI